MFSKGAIDLVEETETHIVIRLLGFFFLVRLLFLGLVGSWNYIMGNRIFKKMYIGISGRKSYRHQTPRVLLLHSKIYAVLKSLKYWFTFYLNYILIFLIFSFNYFCLVFWNLEYHNVIYITWADIKKYCNFFYDLNLPLSTTSNLL